MSIVDKGLYFFAFSLAFCSLIYELAMAQLLAALFGGTVEKYSITVGVFICALGLGSLFVHRFGDHQKLRLFSLELALSFLGFSSPWIAVELSHSISPGWAQLISYFLIFLIGFLSGAELPLLLRARSDWTGKDSSGELIAFDYFGMFVASLLFPLYLVTQFYIQQVVVGVALINLAMAVLWKLTFDRKGYASQSRLSA